ncbi:ABC transporter permease [Alpinimonas psychrophila]|uniref:ABC-type transport system involved in multi-copper enzyme maturation permease subunit n=1 Tax=Alpinimonas psychrophila TaxID=748908 RepID=A0A7W3JSP6_9MICO|nr:ABC transporter permease [Alpinimonas psychrophila]MBA8828412.1 ABC-type transport system involved in multi-copper enzyme maturation permease subunit [Alpinimonas psychrophila]
MIAAMRSETLKLVTVRLWWILALILLGYVGFTAGLLAGLFGALGNQLAASPGAPQLPPESLPAIVYSTTTAVGYVFPLIFGALAVTGEFRYQTLTPTFLAEPRRGVVLAAKLVVVGVAGAIFGVVGLVASMGIGAPVLALTGNDGALGSSETWLLAVRIVLAMALWAVIGVGVGSLIPNQIASIIVVLAFTQFVEPILRFGTSIWDWTAQIGQFLPGSAGDSLVGASFFTSFGAGAAGAVSLEWWQGGLVLVAYAIVLSLAGLATSWRRDVT